MQLKCQHCGCIFEAERKGRKYCSKECQHLAATGKPKSKTIREPVEKECEFCKQKFTTRRKSQRFCNQDCMNKYNSLFRHELTCPTCNKTFFPVRRSQVFCSIKCSKPKKREYYKCTCKKCNTEFEARYREAVLCPDCKVKFKTYKCARWHGHWCNYKGIKIMSTYELRTCNILDIMLEKGLIHDWKYSKDKIKYTGFDNKVHNYIIDFKVYTSESEFFILEVKGVKRPTDDLKWKATINNGYNLQVWFLNDIENKELELDISKEDIKYLLQTCIIKKGE